MRRSILLRRSNLLRRLTSSLLKKQLVFLFSQCVGSSDCGISTGGCLLLSPRGAADLPLVQKATIAGVRVGDLNLVVMDIIIDFVVPT